VEIPRIRLVEIYRILLGIGGGELVAGFTGEISRAHISVGEGGDETAYRRRLRQAVVDPRHGYRSNRGCVRMATVYSLRPRDNQARGGMEETSSCPEVRVLTSGNLSSDAVTIEEILGGC